MFKSKGLNVYLLCYLGFKFCFKQVDISYLSALNQFHNYSVGHGQELISLPSYNLKLATLK